MKLLSSLFTGFTAGLVCSLILSQWTWLDMRVNPGFCIPIGMCISLATIKTKNESSTHIFLLYGAQSLFILIGSFYNFQLEALLTVPAALLRESLFVDSAHLSIMNGILILIVATGNYAAIQHLLMLKKQKA